MDEITVDLDMLLADSYEEAFDNLLKLKQKELIDLCRESGLATSGSKATLATRFLEERYESQPDVIDMTGMVTFVSEIPIENKVASESEDENGDTGKGERI